MLTKSSLEHLQDLFIPGFTNALLLQMQEPHYASMPFEERLSLLIEAEHLRRVNARIDRMLKDAKIPASTASLDNLDLSRDRGINKNFILDLIQGNWISHGKNLIVTGATGTGKTFLSSLIAKEVITRNFGARFHRTSDWLAALRSASLRDRLKATVNGFQRIPLLIFDEWLIDPMPRTEARLLLELFEVRYSKNSILFISQIPVLNWHSQFEDPTLADAILDRIVHGSLRCELLGDSMRRLLASSDSKPQNQDVASLR